ncbi:ornithine decarboxylase 1-like [Diorhabda carinulata]|uniref:ornithine decarboxylase 1-like n=1 Tax=Diorhabda carinulata TaxID=1163345 RepID=UPI0025A2930E|nr:ornithine decarboxylase 1-like [Diorhabda carinulata]
MKIPTANERIHILDGQSNVWTIIREIVKNKSQEDAFYVMDVGEIVKKHQEWCENLPRVTPHYAVKCNDSLAVLETLNSLGVNFDCASKGEINKVLNLNVDPERIIFANPAKPASHIRHAAATGVSTMTFDNETELYKIKNLYPDAKLVIRIRCDATDVQCQLGNKFGCDVVTEAPELLRIAKSLNLNVVGVSFHVGSGCREPPVFRRAISAAREIFDYAETLGYNFYLLDIGGGYPGGRGTSIDKIAEIINLALDDLFPDPSIHVIAEPGRFYVSSAYTLVCNVHSIRNVSNTDPETGNNVMHRMYYINDGVYGSFNCILYDHQVVVPRPLEERLGARYYDSSVWGPTCDGLDQVTEHVMLPEMKVGDWLVFEDMGAYTLPVASPFNGFPIPKVHIVMDDTIRVLLEDTFIVTDGHFEMLTIPNNLKNKTDTTSKYELPTFPINIGNSILDYVDVVAIE